MKHLKKMEEAKKRAHFMQCPECGCHNIKIKKKRYVDFYGQPIVFSCDCSYEKEFVID